MRNNSFTAELYRSCVGKSVPSLPFDSLQACSLGLYASLINVPQDEQATVRYITFATPLGKGGGGGGLKQGTGNFVLATVSAKFSEER